jgi:RNA-directed DNA polymerase
MTRSSDSLVPLAEEQSSVEKWDDKASARQAGGEANARAATEVNAVSASITPPVSKLTQLELFPGRACPLKVKPATSRNVARIRTTRRDGVEGGGTCRQHSKITGETLFGPMDNFGGAESVGRQAYKGSPRNRRNDAGQGVGGGHSTSETRDNRVEGRTATSTERAKRGKAAGLPPRGKAPSRSKTRRQTPPPRMDKARKLQRTLYRVAKSQPQRRLTLLYDKICRIDILKEAWRRVRSNGGAAGVDRMSIEAVREYGEERFVQELQQELHAGSYRVNPVRRVHIPKPGQPGQTRPLGIPTVKDRVVQMAVKLVIEPLFEADFCPCSYGFRPKRTTRMALSVIAKSLKAGYTCVVDVDLKSYFDTIDHDLLMEFVGRRVGDGRVLRLIRAWLKAGVMEEGKVRHPDRGSPQGGVISPVLSNIVLHEIDRQWCTRDGQAIASVQLVRYADDMVLLANTAEAAHQAWERLQEQFAQLRLVVNEQKSRVTTLDDGFAFLGFEFRRRRGRVYLWPRMKARKRIMERVRQKVRSFRSSEPLAVVIGALNPVLWGWCTYFRVGHSNRVFHSIDWAVRQEIQLWLRRKHRCSWRHAQKRWTYHFLHEFYGLYRMVGKVSHLEGL